MSCNIGFDRAEKELSKVCRKGTYYTSATPGLLPSSPGLLERLLLPEQRAHAHTELVGGLGRRDIPPLRPAELQASLLVVCQQPKMISGQET